MNQDKLTNAIAAGQAKATELGTAVSIAIVDEHGTLVHFSRMDQAIKISPKFAFTKAYTSGTLGMPTKGIAEFSAAGKPYFGIESLFGGELTSIAGGLPIKQGEKLVGGVGVGGSLDVSQDEQIAQAVVEALS